MKAETKTIDFSKIKVTWIDGSIKEMDIQKSFSEIVFKYSVDAGEHLFSTRLYENPIMELTEENKAVITKYSSAAYGIFYHIQEAILKQLND